MVQAIKRLNLDEEIELTDNISEADVLLALQSKIKKNLGIQAAAESHGKLVYVTKVFSLMFLGLYPFFSINFRPELQRCCRLALWSN